MTDWTRIAGWAAATIFLAFAMHNLNAWYIEPSYLGFEDPMTDYARVDKLRNAMNSLPWFLSGFGHFASGIAALMLALATNEIFAKARPVAGRAAFGAGLLAGGGFLLTGIADMMGSHALGLLAAQNAAHVDAIYLSGSILRIGFNGLAIVGFAWFALLLSWCGLRTGRLPRALCWFGFFAAASGFVLAFAYVPVYLAVYLVYALWLSLALFRLPAA